MDHRVSGESVHLGVEIVLSMSDWSFVVHACGMPWDLGQRFELLRRGRVGGVGGLAFAGFHVVLDKFLHVAEPLCFPEHSERPVGLLVSLVGDGDGLGLKCLWHH